MKIAVYVFLAIALLGALVASAACKSGGSDGSSQGKLNVVASFYPLYEVAREVGGDKASVSNLTPAGTEPHDFAPSPRDVANLSKARIVVYNGAGMEPWADRVLPDLEKKGATVVNASQSADVLQMADENNPSQKAPDPHFWLDPVIMQSVVSAVKDAYVRVDPANKGYYESNAAEYVARLQALDAEYQAALAPYSRRTIVTSHNAFSYLARRYALDVIFIAGLSPEAEPSAQQLAAISRLAKERGVRYIFFETLASPRLAETAAREVGAQTLVFNPLEGLTGEEIQSGKDYISVMQENLANLRTALEAER